MSNTARLALPYIAPLQSQKQVTYNAAMALLDQLVQPAVKSRTTAAPPGSPAPGDTYIVAPSATDAWAGKDGRFAAWLDGSWSFLTPSNGWIAYVVDTGELALFAAGAWTSFVTNGGSALAKLGINAAADLGNRLAVAADGSLFTHDGTSHRLVINKAATVDTASLLLKDNFSGRAELGLTGDDTLRLKVSPDGSSWLEALSVAQASGLISLPVGQLAFPSVQNPSANANTLDDYEEGTWTPAIKFGGATTGITYGPSTLGRYTKIGRLVTASCICTLTNKGTATGSATLEGLPFGGANDSVYSAAAVGFASGFSSVVGAVLALIQPNSTRLLLYQSNNGAAAGLTNANLTNTSALYLTASYDTA
jgi:hypothetical protein